MEGLEFPAGARSDDVRNRLEELAEAEGIDALRRRLQEVDPETAGRLSDTDRRRIIRALEVFETTGITASKFREESRLRGSPFVFRPFCLSLERSILYARIEDRINRMIMAGLPEEAARVFAASPGNTACQAIGYKEFIPYIEGQATLEEVSKQIKQATRNYAKRQLTWFRHMKTLVWLDNSNPGTTVNQILEMKISG
jgi:tRNA dimethylallyltransferase